MTRNGYYFVKTARLTLIPILLLAVSAAIAGLDKPGSIYNKVQFLDWLVHDSPVSKRVEESGDEEANKQLGRARDLWEQAVEHSEKNEFELAEVHIDEGLKLMTAVSRKFKDQERVRKARVELYKQVRDHVDMFVAAFDRIVEEKGEDHIRQMLDREKLDSLMKAAESSYASGDLVLANHLNIQQVELDRQGARYLDGPAQPVEYGVGKAAVDRMASDMALELEEHGVAALALAPGPVRTEFIVDALAAGAVQLDPERLQAPRFAGRCVAALAMDPDVMEKTGGRYTVADLAGEYRFSSPDP